MGVFAGAVMVGAAGLCLGGSLRSRRPLAVIAAAIMLVSMFDLVVTGFVPAIVWSAALVVAGILLGVTLRSERRAACGAQAGPGGASPSAMHRLVMITSAVAYPAMAWLVLVHDHGGAGSASASASQHAGHLHGAWLTGMAPLVVIALLGLLLAGLGVAAAVRRRTALAVEGFGMSAMLLVMIVPMS